jgi:hypothetical protein
MDPCAFVRREPGLFYNLMYPCASVRREPSLSTSMYPCASVRREPSLSSCAVLSPLGLGGAVTPGHPHVNGVRSAVLCVVCDCHATSMRGCFGD